MIIQKLQKEVIDAAFKLYNAKSSLRTTAQNVLESQSEYNIIFEKYEQALKEQNKFEHQSVIAGCITLVCSAKDISRL